MATSRDEKDIRDAFRELPTEAIDTSSEEMIRDMTLYINARLSHDPNFCWMKSQIKGYIIEKLMAETGCPRM